MLVSWDGARRLDRWQVAEVLVGFGALALTRTLGLLFTAMALVFVAAFAEPGRMRVFITDRRAWKMALPAGAISVLAASWVLLNGHLDAVPGAPLGPEDRPIVFLGGVSDDFLRQMVAIFGWKDTGPVTQSVMPWMAALAALVGISLLVTTTWRRIVLLLTIVATVVLPILMQLDTLDRDGFAWQGRYLLPFAVGVPLLAAAAAQPAFEAFRGGLRAVCVTITSLCAVGLIAGFWVWMHRVSVGIDGKALNPLHWKGWEPPVSAASLIVVLTLVALVPVAYVATCTELRPGGERLDKPL